MQPSQAMERFREKVEEVAEKTGKVIGRGLSDGWGKATGLGEDLKKELLRLYRKTGRKRISEKKVARARNKSRSQHRKTNVR